jgi:multiple sugar transport system ATP-binding protein
VSLTESLGSDIFAYFEFEGEAAQSEELQDLAADAGTLDVPGRRRPARGRARRPDVDGPGGQRAKLWMDTSKLHLFDAQDGRNLTLAEGVGSTRATAAEPQRRRP